MTFLASFSKQITKPLDDSEDAISLLDWQVIAETCTLRNLQTGTDVRITPRGMEVLMHLIEHPEKVINANELLDLFWSKSVRSDHAVHNVIAELRAALGDQASNPRYIKTYPKRGYALLIKPMPSSTPGLGKNSRKNISNTHSIFKKFEGNIFVTVALSFLTLLILLSYLLSNQSPNTEPIAQQTLLVEAFETINLAPNAAYLSRQLPGSLVSRLSKLPNAQVMVSQGTFHNQEFVDYLLNGNIQQVNGEHRVQVNLMDARSNLILFSDQFNFSSEEIFNIQDEIVQHVAIALRIYLDEELRNDMRDWGTSSALAYDAFLKAEFYADNSNHASFRNSIDNYLFAIQQDPDFSNAYLGLANVATKMGLYSLPETGAEMRKLVNMALQQLLRLNPDSQSAKATQFLALRVEGNNQKIIEKNLRALIMQGNPPDYALSHYSTLLASANLFRESRDFLRYVPDERPHEVSTDATWTYRTTMDTPMDLIHIKKQQLLDKPSHLGILGSLSRNYAFLGERELAIEYLSRQMELDEQGPSSMLSQVIISALYGTSNLAGDVFEAKHRDDPNFNFAFGTKAFILGDIETGIEKWSNLNASDTRRLFSWLSYVRIFFPDEVLTNDRYDALLEDLGIGVSWQRHLMESVVEMTQVTGIPLSDESKSAYAADQRFTRNNLWDHSDICYRCLRSTASVSPMEGNRF